MLLKLFIISMMLLLIGATSASEPVPYTDHWHSYGPHGTHLNQQLNQEDCEALFGGEGWE